MTEPAAPLRCGRLAIVGQPNVGKSTLLNALIGQKLSITSRKAQTTRHQLQGVRTEGEAQFVFVDTPGFQTRHANALNRTLNRTVTAVLGGVDAVLFVVQAGRFDLADAKVLDLLDPAIPTLLLANKLDKVHRRADLLPWLRDMQSRFDFVHLLPMSAKNPPIFKPCSSSVALCCPSSRGCLRPTTSPTAASAFWPLKWCVKNSFVSRVTSCLTPLPW